MNTTTNFQVSPEFITFIAREHQQEMLREAAQRRLAKAARKSGQRTRTRYFRWR